MMVSPETWSCFSFWRGFADPISPSPSPPDPRPAPRRATPRQAIKVAHGGDAEREAVREGVRRQRRKIARSMSHENASSSYQLSPMAEHPEHDGGASEGTAAGLSDGDMGSYGSKIVISRSSSMSPRTLARRQNERQHQYGSSGSDLRSLGSLSEVPYAGGGGIGGGIGGGDWGGAQGPSRTTSGYSEARLTSASTLTSFNEESTIGSPGSGTGVRLCVLYCVVWKFFYRGGGKGVGAAILLNLAQAVK